MQTGPIGLFVTSARRHQPLAIAIIGSLIAALQLLLPILLRLLEKG